MSRARFAAICFGTLLALALVEAALQGAALVARWQGRPDALATLTDQRRIVALGDSNTYGIFLEPGEAYPAVVAREWARRQAASAPPTEIINLAYPGTSSSVLLARLPEILRATTPAEVWLMVGVNDYWTAPPSFARGESATSAGVHQTDAPADSTALFARVHALLWDRLRTYRMLMIAWRSRDAGVLESREYDRSELHAEGPPAPPEHRARVPSEGVFAVGGARIRLGHRGLPDGVYPGGILAMETISERLAEAVAMIRRSGARPVLVTYPYPRGMYGLASGQMREVAAAGQVDLVDAGERLAQACPADPCRDLFFDDFHPTARTHAIIAGMILEAGGLDPQRPRSGPAHRPVVDPDAAARRGTMAADPTGTASP